METPKMEVEKDRRLLLSAGVLTIVGDYLLGPGWPGLALGLFMVGVLVALVMNRSRWTLVGVGAALLLLATAVQAAVERSMSNTLVMGVLVLVLVGETSFSGGRWARWSEAVWAFLKAPMLWRWALGVVQGWPRAPRPAADPSEPPPLPDSRWSLGKLIRVVGPALFLGGAFTILLGSGNAIFARRVGDLINALWGAFPGLDLSLGRLWLRVLLGTFALGLLRPSLPPEGIQRPWTRPIPGFPVAQDLTVARWRSLAILGLLNLVFFTVNTVDGLYLWFHGVLPEGINYSEFVHNGVESLVAAVLLSALVLVVIFHQSENVINHRWMRLLALVWIVQNVFLIASVLLRLKLYVDAYQLTELRIYVGFFLVLVSTGFGLLAWRIWWGKDLGWLIFANGCAVFALFFTVQFLDVARWVADANVERWKKDPKQSLDIEYLGRLGPSAYPALVTAAGVRGRADARAAFLLVQALKEVERERAADLDWRSSQLRRDRLARWLLTGQE